MLAERFESELPIEQIHVSHNVRRHFDEQALTELAQSIQEFGIQEPLIVRPVDSGFELVAGERRMRAATLAGLTTVPALVREMDASTAARLQLLENLQRKDLDPVEEARGFDQLIKEHGFRARELARQLGVSEAFISNRRRLLRLPDQTLEDISREKISASVALSLVDLADYPDVAASVGEHLVRQEATQANAERVAGQYLSQAYPVVGSENRYMVKACDPEAHLQCPCRRKVSSGYGNPVAVCVDAQRYSAVEAEAKMRLETQAQKEAQTSAVAGDGRLEKPIDLTKGKWRRGDYGSDAAYRVIGKNSAVGGERGAEARHTACACRRLGANHAGRTDGRSLCAICIDPKTYDRIEKVALREHNRRIRDDEKRQMDEARTWAERRARETWHDIVGQPTLGPVELAYLAAIVVGRIEPMYDGTGRRRIERSAFLRGLGLDERQAGATGALLARHLTGLPSATLWRALWEWPLLAGGRDVYGNSSQGMGDWYRQVVSTGLHDDHCDLCGEMRPVEMLTTYQAIERSSSVLPLGTWAVVCSDCDRKVEFRWRSGLTQTRDEDREPGERITAEQAVGLKMRSAVGPVASADGDEEDNAEDPDENIQGDEEGEDLRVASTSV